MTVTIASPIGPLTLEAEGEFLTGLRFGGEITPLGELSPGCMGEQQMLAFATSPVLRLCIDELEAYFEGKLQNFTVPLHAKGTAFRKQVWEELCRIPYGETASYKDIAKRIGNPKAVRAVGGANHNNPISIIVPCHRVVGAGGALTGFGGGLPAKKWLLEWEAKHKKN